MLRPIALLSFLIVFASCNHSSSNNDKQLKVSYKVTVLRSDLASFATLALPDEIMFYHSDTKSMIDIQTIIGNIRIRQIADSKKGGTNAIVLDYFNKRISCMTNEPSYFFLPFFNKVKLSDLEGDTIIESQDCKLKKVVFEENSSTAYTLMYTDYANCKKINQCTPYQDVPGLLMRFEMHSPKLDLQLISSKLIKEALPDSIFEIPEGYENVSPATMRSILLSLFGSEI